MVNRVDGVILGVGVVVLVASVIGVILYDEQSPQTFAISWGQSEAMDLDQQTDSGGPADYAFETNVTQEALARTEFAVEVTASGGTNINDDSVEVEVTTPEGNAKTCSFTIPGGQTSATGSCTVEFGVNGRPDVSTVTAVNATEARQKAIDEAGLTNGTGTWVTNVTVDGGGQELTDPNYEVTLTPTLFAWEATPTQPGPSGRAG